MITESVDEGPVRFASRVALPLIATAPHSGCRVSVVVPARNEAEHLPRTLAALRDQVDQCGRRLPPDLYEVAILVNNSSDASAEICRQFAEHPPHFVLHVAEIDLPMGQSAVGHARRLLMDEAVRRFTGRDPRHTLIASLDADTRVAHDWITTTLDAVAAGADCVAGRIFIDPADRHLLPLQSRRRLLQRVGYEHLLAEWETRLDPVPWDPWPRHRQHFGASLAMTVDTYVRAGGLPITDEHEDELLYQAVQRIDARVRHSPRVRVWTSGRLAGRALDGLAGQLTRWANVTPVRSKTWWSIRR